MNHVGLRRIGRALHSSLQITPVLHRYYTGIVPYHYSGNAKVVVLNVKGATHIDLFVEFCKSQVFPRTIFKSKKSIASTFDLDF
jgi:hypothetical protein